MRSCVNPSSSTNLSRPNVQCQSEGVTANRLPDWFRSPSLLAAASDRFRLEHQRNWWRNSCSQRPLDDEIPPLENNPSRTRSRGHAMWNSLFRSSALCESPKSKVVSRAHRRRRRLFAGAECLETRALLSATGADSTPEFVPLTDTPANLPAVPADIVLTSEVGSGSSFLSAEIFHRLGIDLGTSDNLGTPDFSAVSWRSPVSDLSLNSVRFLDSEFSLSDAVMQSNSIPFPLYATNSGFGSAIEISSAITQLSFDHFSPTVELRSPETGQVVAVGSGASVQDASGLTINDGNSPATYVRTIDADGRSYSRLVFVTRASNSAPVPEQQSTISAPGVVVAEANDSESSNSEEPVARPDLHDLETVLDAASEQKMTPSPTSRQLDSPPSLAAATRTRWGNSTRVIATNGWGTRTGNGTHDNSVTAQPSSLANMNDHLGAESDESSAVPIFEPTTRNVLLSICLLGSLARATSRQRRRLKAAIAH